MKRIYNEAKTTAKDVLFIITAGVALTLMVCGEWLIELLFAVLGI